MGESGVHVGTREKWYDVDGGSKVVLLQHPGREMEWYEWGQALRGLLWFAGGFDGVELYFDVFVRDAGDGELRLKGTWALARWDGGGGDRKQGVIMDLELDV